MKRLLPVFLFTLLVLSGCAAPTVVPTYKSSPEMRKQVEALRTTDQNEIRRRWGDLASIADKSWMHAPANSSSRFGLDARWVVPGAAMNIAFAWCNTGNCMKEWTVQYNAAHQRLDFIALPDNLLDKTGTVQKDGWVLAVSEEMPTNDKWKYDPASNTLMIAGIMTYHIYAEVSREQLVATLAVLKNSLLPVDATTMATTATSTKPVSRKEASNIKAAEAAKPAQLAKATAEEQPWAKVKPGSFGPFDSAVGNVYSKNDTSLLVAKVTKEKDGSLNLSRQVLSTSTHYPPAYWTMHPTRKGGIYESSVNLGPNASSYINRKATLLPDGELQVQFDSTYEGQRWRQYDNWRVSPSSLTRTTQSFKVNADETLTQLSQPGVEVFSLSSHAAVQAQHQAAIELAENNRRALEERQAYRGESSRADRGENGRAYRGESRVDRGPPVEPRAERSFMETFASTFQQEMRNKQVQQANQQAFLNNLAQQTRAIEREREREAEARERAAERDRRDRQAYSTSSSNSYSASASISRSTPVATDRSSQTSSRETDLQRKSSMPRSETSTAAAVSHKPGTSTTIAANTSSRTDKEDYWAARRAGADHAEASGNAKSGNASLGRAGAWCVKTNNDMFVCKGPLQSLWAPEKTLEIALGRVGCPGGKGYSPSKVSGEYFDCGRELRASDNKMPTYDPYANYNKQ